MELDAKFDEKIMSLVAEGIPGKFKRTRIVPQTHLQKELGLDSIGMLSLVFRFEEVFGIDIAKLGIDIDIARVKTVSDLLGLARLIMTKVEAVG